MDSFKDILTANGARLDVAKDIEALKALVELREKWKDLSKDGSTPDAAAILGFVEKLLDPSSSDSVLAKLDAAGQRDAKRISAALAGIADVFHKIDPKYFALVTPVAAFDEDAANKDVGRVQWKALGVDKTVKPPKKAGDDQSDYSLDLGLEASLTLEAGDTWPDEAPDVPDPLLRIGFIGGLEVSAKATLPLSLGSLKLGAEAAREAAIDYYFDARKDQRLYGAAVIDRLDDLPNPWSLESVMSAIDSSDFVGAVFETQGHSGFTLQVSVADGLALTSGITLGASLQFDVKVKRAGTYNLKLRRLVAPGASSRALEVTVERTRTSERERGVELGIDVDLAAVGRKLAAILGQHESDIKKILDKYKDFLTPGTFLKEGANDLLTEFVEDATEDVTLREALEDALQRALGLSAADGDGKLAELLEQKVSDAFDAASGVITGAIDDVEKQLAEDFLAKTGLPADLLGNVSGKLRSIVVGLREKLEARAKTAVEGPAKELAEAGKKRKKKADALVARADDAAAPVREAIGRYEQGLKKLKDAVSDAARMKVVAKISAEATSKLERGVDAKLIFRRASPEAIKIYHDVVRGDFDAILSLVGKGHPDVSVDPDATTLHAFKATGRKFGYTLVLLGFEFGASTVFDTTSKVLVEGNGKVSVLTDLTWKRRQGKPREAREISFVDSYELLAAKETDDFSIGLGLSHQDEVLKRKEVEGLIGSFERAALVPRGTTERALLQFTAWFGPGDKTRIVTDLNLGLRLEKKEALQLLCLGERAGDLLGPSGRRRVFGAVLGELVDAGLHTREELEDLARAVLGQSDVGAASLADTLFDLPKARQPLSAVSSRSPTGNQRRLGDLRQATEVNETCMSFVELVDRMGDVFTATPGLAPAPGVWTVAEYDEAQRDINRHLRDWLKKTGVFRHDGEAHPRTIAFIGALASLAGVAVTDQRSVMSLTMTRRMDKPETVTLC